MNLKLAKKLRKIAKGLWQNSGAPSFEEYMETKYTEEVKNRKQIIEYEKDADGRFVTNEQGELKVKTKHTVSDGTVSIIKTCFRGQYRSMKRAIAA